MFGVCHLVAGELHLPERDCEDRMQMPSFKDSGNLMVDELVDWAIRLKVTNKDRIYTQWQSKFLSWFSYVMDNEELPKGVNVPYGNHKEILKLVQKIKQEKKKICESAILTKEQ